MLATCAVSSCAATRVLLDDGRDGVCAEDVDDFRVQREIVPPPPGLEEDGVTCVLHSATLRGSGGSAAAPAQRSGIPVRQSARLVSLRVSAELSMRHFAGTRVRLDVETPAPLPVAQGGAPSPAPRLTGARSPRSVVLKAAPTGKGLKSDHPEILSETDAVRVSWSAGSAAATSAAPDFVAAFEESLATRGDPNRPVALGEIAPDGPLASLLASASPGRTNGTHKTPQTNGGHGGAFGTWTLALDAPASEPASIAAWALETCFVVGQAAPEGAASSAREEGAQGPAANDAGVYASCNAPPEQSKESVAAASALLFGDEAPMVTAMSGPPMVTAMSGPPGGAISRRFRDENRCLEARFTWNLFERMNGRYCCAKSRVLFLRHWWRKNFTPRCRRFFRA